MSAQVSGSQVIGVHKEQRPRTEASAGASQRVGKMTADSTAACHNYAFADKGLLVFSQVSPYKIVAVYSHWRVSLEFDATRAHLKPLHKRIVAPKLYLTDGWRYAETDSEPYWFRLENQQRSTDLETV